MSGPYLYYRIRDTNGPVEVKYPLPTNVLDDKFLGRIDITRIAPLTNGQNIKLAIAQYEGFQETFDVSGASLYNGSWLVPDPWVLSPVTGFGLQNPIVVVFPVKLTRSQASGSSASPASQSDDISDFVGKWQHSIVSTNKTTRFDIRRDFSIVRTRSNTLAASGHEFSYTHHRSWLSPKRGKHKALPPDAKTEYELSEFKVLGASNISFVRKNIRNGLIWKMEGSLGTDRTLMTLIGTPVGHATAIPVRLYKRVA
ncbi:hypothetical protein AB1N83_007726 [Pleurotus pulmonarius]|nr:hypothetical protein EYR36_004994 [Pleurotus pulmonarius]